MSKSYSGRRRKSPLDRPAAVPLNKEFVSDMPDNSWKITNLDVHMYFEVQKLVLGLVDPPIYGLREVAMGEEERSEGGGDFEYILTHQLGDESLLVGH